MSANNNSKFFRAIHIIGDLALLNFSFFIGNLVQHGNITYVFSDHYVKQFLYLNLFWFAATFLLRVYDIRRVMRLGTILNILVKAFLLHVFLIFTFIVVFDQHIYSLKAFSAKYLLFSTLIVFWRLAFLLFLKYLRKQGLNYRRVIIAGAGQLGNELYGFFMNNPEHGYRCLGFFDDKIKNGNILGELKDVEEFTINNKVDEIYCALPDVSHEKVQQLITFADRNLVRLKVIPDFRSIQNKKVEINFYDNTPVLTIRKEPLENLWNRMLKRAFDFSFSLVVILTIFPWLFPLIAIAIKLSSKGPVLFKQLRSGRGNHAFLCYKFRSMETNFLADELQATINDPRITRVGKFLRKTNLDELPQFYNVLIGNMSVVGPRPHMLSHTEKYSKEIEKFMVRHFVKSGITGLAQVRGFRGETKDPTLMDKRIQWDLWYIENWSFFFDMKIILLTVFNMVKGDNKGA